MRRSAQGLIERYKYVNGKHFRERKHWLQDDYVKFIAFAQKKMDEVQEGIVGVITNHNYMDGPTFRGMRQSLMSTFNVIFLVDLHGSIQRIEDVPEDTTDQNVFDIKPGVAIGLFVKSSIIDRFIRKTDLWGKRRDKYRCLAQNSIGNFRWFDLNPSSPGGF